MVELHYNIWIVSSLHIKGEKLNAYAAQMRGALIYSAMGSVSY